MKLDDELARRQRETALLAIGVLLGVAVTVLCVVIAMLL